MGAATEKEPLGKRWASTYLQRDFTPTSQSKSKRVDSPEIREDAGFLRRLNKRENTRVRQTHPSSCVIAGIGGSRKWAWGPCSPPRCQSQIPGSARGCRQQQ